MPDLETYVALFRGVNVGGKNKLPMKGLAEIFVEAGCANVRTFIQSGNVVFCASADLIGNVACLVSESVLERFQVRSPIVLRSLDQMRAVGSKNPYLDCPEDSLFVLFLTGTPSEEAVGSLDQNRSAPDRFQVVGNDVYMTLPNGAAKTKLTNAYFDSKLKTVSTSRNWRTVSRLLEMMSDHPA